MFKKIKVLKVLIISNYKYDGNKVSDYLLKYPKSRLIVSLINSLSQVVNELQNFENQSIFTIQMS